MNKGRKFLEVGWVVGRVVLVKELGPGTKDVALGPEDGLARDGIYIVRAKSSWRLLKQRLVMVK